MSDFIPWRCPNCGITSRARDTDFPLACVCGVLHERRPQHDSRALRALMNDWGSGTEFKRLLEELGIHAIPGCDCKALELEMNRLGVERCKREREALLTRLGANAAQYGWLTKIAAGLRALASDAPLTLAGLFDEAVRRIEVIEQPLPFAGPLKRNLVYHCGPFAGNGVWQRNVQQLLARMKLFNGKRVVTILTGDNMDPPHLVRAAFRGQVSHFIEVANDPAKREVASWPHLMNAVESSDPNEITFFAHAKGVRHPVNDGVTVHRWTDIMYETCLDYLPLVDSLLERHPTAGSFKRVDGRSFAGSPSRWHYSGTFYWLRHAKVFHRPSWRRIDQAWWGTESWPGLQFPADCGGTIFLESDDPGLDLYQMGVLRERVEPAYAAWKEAHAEFAR